MPQVRVQSDSDPSTTYLVDPVAGTCSCPSSARLQEQGGKDVCKHVKRVRATGGVPAAEEPPAPTPGVALVLAHPDPSPDDLPDTIPAEMVATIETAARILRAVKRLEVSIEEQTRRRNADLRDWDAAIGREQARVDSWKAGILGWMQAHGIEQIKHPAIGTAYIRKGGSKIVLDNEDQAKAAIKALNYPAALESVERIVWEEFKVLFDSAPDKFAAVKDAESGEVIRPAIAHRETGEPSLVIRKGKAKE